MTSPFIRRVLQSCLQSQALEVWLVSGRPPILRFRECVRELVTGNALSSAEITDLVLDGCASAMGYWSNVDFFRFDHKCDWHDATFRVFLVRHGEAAMATMTPLPDGTPELEYAEDKPGAN